ncbi:hypothetical protein M5E86_02150 [Blautia wexlerae]|nr:hypothetical protein M5E86_02150 [Blautia wexlerae]
MTDAFSRCHPILNFFYFAVVLGFTMFIQHPVYLAVSFVVATAYSMWLNGVGKVLKINFLPDNSKSFDRRTAESDV